MNRMFKCIVLIGFCFQATALFAAPTANNGAFYALSGSTAPLTIDFNGYCAGVTGVPTFTIVTSPTKGSLVPIGGSQFRYTPVAGASLTDSFTWRVADGTGNSNVATATIYFVSPYAYNLTKSALVGFTARISLTGYYTSTGTMPVITIVTPPTKGVLVQVGGDQFDYTANPGATGGDSFKWKITYGSLDSNVATVTINYVANTSPSLTSKKARAFTAVRTRLTGLAFDDDDIPRYNQTATVKVSKLPVNGKLEYYDSGTDSYKPVVLNAVLPSSLVTYAGIFGTYHVLLSYTSNVGYAGTDTFDWTVFDGVKTSKSTCPIAVITDLYGKDWPMYRRDSNRTAMTPWDLPSTLRLQWTRNLPKLTPAWSGNTSWNNSCLFDLGYEPIVVGKTVYIASNQTDSITAYDTDTGAEKWRFYAGGAIRLAPAAWKDGGITRVYFGSDDGYFYCINGDTGLEMWKIQAGPHDRFFFSNHRMSSTWMVRGGAMVSDGKVYFASGLIAFEGVFVYAVDGRTGSILWKDDSGGLLRSIEPHSGAGIGGISPQGSLVMDELGAKFYVPSGRATPGAFNLLTGKMDPWSQRDNGDVMSVFVDMNGNLAPWSVNIGSITVGAGVYTTAPGVTGTVHSLVAADDKLFVVNRDGQIYCFGGATVGTPPVYSESSTPLPVVSDQWKTMATQILADNPEGSCQVWGISSGRLVEELAIQARAKSLKLSIDVFDASAVNCNALRRKLDGAGLYGTEDSNVKVTVRALDPWNVEFPQYAGRIITTEDATRAGFGNGTAFVQKLFSALRPYGGTAWLPISAADHASFSSSVSSLSLANAVVNQSGGISLLSRNGALPGASNFVNTGGTADVVSLDDVAKPPFGVQWTGDEYLFGSEQYAFVDPDIVDGKLIPAVYNSYLPNNNFDVYTGLPFTGRTPWSGEKSVKGSATHGMRANPFNGLMESRTPRVMWGCGAPANYGKHLTFRSGSAAFYHIPTETGTVNMGVLRPGCSSRGMIPANGLLLVGGSPGWHHCACAYQLRSNIILVNRADGFQQARWSRDRSARAIEEDPIRKLGINFGTIGERMNNGVLWIHRPATIEDSPNIPVTLHPSANIQRYCHDKSYVTGTNTWITSSGIKGVENLRVDLGYPSLVAQSCSTAPVIDGVLSDGCWDGNSALILYGREFGDYVAEQANYLENGTVQFRYDASKLYVAFKHAGDAAKASHGEGWDLFISDTTQVKTKNLHFGVTTAGVRYDAMGVQTTGRDDVTWNGAWNSGFKISVAEFTVEMEIPWTTIEAEGFNKNDLVLNVQGVDVTPQSNRTDMLILRGATWQPGTNIACDRFVRLFFNSTTGELARLKTYDVSMYFAEPDNLAVGGRVFDIQIQGVTVASNFDIVKEAGGARKSIVKKFTGVNIKDWLDVKFIPKSGTPIISGMEMIEQGGPVPDVTAPTAPTGLVATVISSSQINLTWTAATDSGGIAGYQVYYGTASSVADPITATKGTSCTVTGLKPSTRYYFRVAAFDKAWNVSAQAGPVNATTAAPSTDTTLPTVTLTTPTGGSVSGTITLSANASDDVGVTGVQFKVNGADVGSLDMAVPYSMSWDTLAVVNGVYSITAEARDAAGNTTISSGVSVTVNNAVVVDGDLDGLLDAWEITYFRSISDPRAIPGADPDGDGFDNLAEQAAETSPVDSASRLAVMTQNFSGSSFTIQWQSVSGKTYEVQSSTNMTGWSTIISVTATTVNTTWTDASPGIGRKFYRIRIP